MTEGSHHQERLSAIEVEHRNLLERFTSLDRNVEQRFNSLTNAMQEGFAAQRKAMESQRQPITAFAGWAAVILTMVFAFGSPLKESDRKLSSEIDKLRDQVRHTFTEIEKRELENAYLNGVSKQQFNTLEKQLEGAIQNRSDKDRQHVETAASNRRAIDSYMIDVQRQFKAVEHSVGNGLGVRIDEKTLPLLVEIEWLKSELKRLVSE